MALRLWVIWRKVLSGWTSPVLTDYLYAMSVFETEKL